MYVIDVAFFNGHKEKFEIVAGNINSAIAVMRNRIKAKNLTAVICGWGLVK
jgi:hypothetical protein